MTKRERKQTFVKMRWEILINPRFMCLGLEHCGHNVMGVFS